MTVMSSAMLFPTYSLVFWAGTGVGKLQARASPVKIDEHLENLNRIATLLFKRSHFTP
jgi:hypothetical protein